jgi:hypothetical protein
MGKFVEGVKSLFGGGSNDDLARAQQRQAQQNREQQQVDIARQQQTLQNQQSDQDVQTGRALRIPRGRKLLLASTGEAGLPTKLGG